MENVQKMEKPNLSYIKRIVHRGMSGKDIKAIQERLESLNQVYKFCPIPWINDKEGIFGKDTHSYVTFFQIWMDICTDGWVDKVTADTIEASYQSIVQAYAVPTTNISHSIWDRYN